MDTGKLLRFFFIGLLLFSCGRYIIEEDTLKIKEVEKITPEVKVEKEQRTAENTFTLLDGSFARVGFTETGIASWYGEEFHGKPTASGEIYDMHSVIAAHKYLPIGTKVKVDDLKSGNSIVVEIRDRGPYIHGRIIDLSVAAAKELGYYRSGLAEVKITVLEIPQTYPDYFLIHIGKYNDLEKAIDVQKKYVGKRFPTFIVETDNYDVVIGPYTSEDRANMYNERLKEHHLKKGVVRKCTK